MTKTITKDEARYKEFCSAARFYKRTPQGGPGYAIIGPDGHSIWDKDIAELRRKWEAALDADESNA